MIFNAFQSPTIHPGRDWNNYFQQINEVYNEHSNGFNYHKDLVEELLRLQTIGFDVLPLRQAYKKENNEKRTLALRYDIDADPVTGTLCAQNLARFGLSGSFYLLHTAPYYGDYYGSHFVRNPALKEWILKLIIAGSEIGLHIDTLKLYQDFDIDGLKALEEELMWVRAVGAMVDGVVAHNSGPIYGAENYEIFKEHKLWSRKIFSQQGRKIPLGKISLSQLGLKYEGTFSKPKDRIDKSKATAFFANKEDSNIRNPEWMKTYLTDNPCCDWSSDYQVWLVGKDHWTIGSSQTKFFKDKLTFKEMIQCLEDIPNNNTILMVLHPAYFRDIPEKENQ